MKDLYKILSGKILVKLNGSIITIGPFSFEDLYRAELYADEVFDQEFTSGCFTEVEIEDLLIENGWWSQEDLELFNKIPDILEQMKLDYFNNFHSESTKTYIKDNIKMQKDILYGLLEKKRYLYKYTCEYSRAQSYTNFLIENCSFIDGNKVDFSRFSLTSLILKYNDELLSDEEIRDISKSQEFRFLWSAHKESLSQDCFSNMKTSLINWARVYDNVYESMDCPNEDIIQDNLALDGWFILRRKKREDERKKNAAESKLGEKLSKAGEIFIPVKSQQEAKSIYDLNTAEAKRKLSLLEKDLKNNTSISDQNLTSNKQEIAMASNRAAIDALRNR